MTKVGDTLYRLSRFHKPGQSNRWSPEVITAETSGLWKIGDGWRQISVNKKTLMTAADRQGMKDQYFTAEGRDALDFCTKYASHIGSAVSVCDDPEKLKAIASIIGMELEP